MKRTMKQVLGIVLSVLLLLSVLPVGVLGAAETDAGKILNDAYALAEGAVLDYEATLTGKITKIDTPYNSVYKNISVIIEVPGHADKPMLCYRLKGDGADTLAVGDTITVTGQINNYYGRIEFAAGCSLDSVVPGDGLPVVAPEDPKQIVDEAYALAGGESLPYSAVLVGKIISVETPYDEIYKNITVTIEVAGREGQPIQCYRMKGTGVEELKIGDTIKVEGQIKRYIKTDAETGEVILDLVEFNVPNFLELISDSGVDPTEPTEPTDPTPTTPLEIVDAAYALQDGESLEGIYTLTGEIIAVDTPWSELFYNITVTIIVEDRPIQCYRLSGDGADLLTVGTTITVTGTLTNYRGTIEFAQGCTLDAVSYGEYVISQGTLEFPAPDIEFVEAYIEFVSTDNGTVTLTLSEVEPHFHVVIYEDNLWLTDFQGTVAPAEKEFQVKKDSHYTVILSAVLYQNSNLDAWTQIGGYLTYKLTSDVSVRDLSHWNPTDPWTVVDAAYMLGPGEALPYEPTLTGTITEIVTEYSEQYMNITVNMVVAGREDKPLQCYRMSGNGVDTLKVGDTITVTGTLKNYTKTNAETGETITTIEFYPCTLLEVISVDDWGPESLAMVGSGIPGIMDWNPADPAGDMTEVSDHVYEIVVECPAGTFMQFKFAGNDTWDDQWIFGGTAVVLEQTNQLICGVGGQDMYLSVDESCTLRFTVDLNDMYYGGNATLLVEKLPEPGSDPCAIVDEAYTLGPGEALPYEPTLTGTITEIVTEYSEQYMNITVNMVVAGREDKPLQCYRMSGNGVDTLKVGDTITVTGTLKNYTKTNAETGETITTIEFYPCTLLEVISVDDWGPESLALVGSGIPGLVDWNPADPAGDMTEVSDHVYEIVVECPAGTSMQFKFAGNDTWDDQWNFGSDYFVPNRLCQLTCGGGSSNMYLTVEKNCTLLFTVDLNGMRYGGNATLLVEEIIGPEPTRKLTVIAPSTWNSVWAYTWDPESFNLWPGTELPMFGGVSQTEVSGSMENLVLSGLLEDGNREHTGDIYLEDNGLDVVITVAVDCTYQINYVEKNKDTFRVAGNAYWMGDWDPASDVGVMTEVSAGVYQKCFENVAPGSYEFLITKNGTWDERWGDGDGNYCFTVTKTCDVTVTFTYLDGEGIIDVDYIGGIMGDVSGDGRLNMGDVAKLYAHIRNTNPLTDEAALIAADFTGDGKINIGDTARIYAYIRGTDPAAIVDGAYQLGQGEEMSKDSTLTGTVLDIIEPYDDRYGCITVIMAISGREDYPIVCSRLMGENARNVGVNDKITVTGILRNFYGSIEFKEGCQLVKWEDVPNYEEYLAQIVDEAYALGDGETMDRDETLMGKVISIDQAYIAGLPYISLTMAVEGREDKPISCYRLMGDGIEWVRIGDTVTVTGTLRNFYGVVEFAAGCVLEDWVSDYPEIEVETDPLKIVDLAYELWEGEEIPYNVTLTGKVIEISDAFNSQYQNISVVIEVPGREGFPILCYRLTGEGVASIASYDTITVEGRLRNYYGEIEVYNCIMTNRVSGGGQPIVPETDAAKILAAGQLLDDFEELPYSVTLGGKVVSIDDAYNADFCNISVTIAVDGTDQTLTVYRLKGDGVEMIAVNDIITAEGRIKKYNGRLELVDGIMISRISGGGNAPVVQTDYKKIVDEAYALAEGAQLPYDVTLEGKIVELITPYDALYMNMTVAIEVPGREGMPIECYRLKGADIGNHLCMGDTITVTGRIKNYQGTIEFDAGCQMTEWTAGNTSKPTDPQQIVDAAFALGKNEVLPYFATLTGTVKSVDTPYSDQYRNVTVTITVQGTDVPRDIVCYRLRGEQAANVAVGSTITVTGAIKNYVGIDKETGAEKPPMVEFDAGCLLESLQP